MKGPLGRLAGSDVGRESALLFLSLLLLNVSSYVFYALAGRVLPVSEYGVMMSLLSLMLVMTAPAMVAQNSLSKLVADVAAAGIPSAVGGIARSVERFAAIVAFAVLIVGVFLRNPISALVHSADPLLVPLVALIAAGATILPLQRGVFQGAACFGDLALSMAVESLVRIATVVPLARFGGVRGALLAMAFAQFAPIISSALRSRAIWAPWIGVAVIDLRRAYLAALQTGAGFLAITAMLYFDVILVRHFFSSYVAGLYSEVSLVGRAIYSVVAFVPMIVIPKVVSRRAGGKSIRAIVLLASGIMAIASICAVALVAIAPQRVLTIIGGLAFRPAAPYLLAYAFAASMLAAENVTVAIRVGLHRFAHVAPLAIILFGEVLAVMLRHQQVSDVLWIIVAGHTLALTTTLAITMLESFPGLKKQESRQPSRTVSIRK